MLPNFLIIGAPRSGTTYLYQMLKQHSDIFMPEVRHPGDVHFFNPETKIRVDKQTNWDKGLEWYASFFDGYKNEKAVGEKTASYLTDERAPELISQTLGNEVKMVVILRNPIYRAFSNFLYFSGQIPQNITLLEACQSKEYQRLELLESGNYFKHLTRYFKHFSKDHFHFIVYDDLCTNPLKTIQHTFQFLEVDPEFIPEHYEKFYNKAIGGNFLSKILKKKGGQLKHKYPKIYSILEKTAIGNVVFKLLSSSSSGNVSKKKDYSTMFTQEEWNFLNNYYYDQDKKLSEILNRDLIKLWHKPY